MSSIKLPDELRCLTAEEMDAIRAECPSWNCKTIGRAGHCIGYHCSYCGEPCSMMGHDCERGERVRQAERERA